MIELGGIYGNTTLNGVGLDGANVGVNQIGVRPIIKYMNGPLAAKVGVDYLLQTPKVDAANGEKTKLGFAGDVALQFGRFTVGAVAASGTEDGKSFVDDSGLNDVTTTSFGSYTKIGLGEDLLSVAAAYWSEDLDDSNEMYIYGAYVHKMALFNNTQLKFGVSYASAQDVPAGDNDEDKNAFGAMVKLWTGF